MCHNRPRYDMHHITQQDTTHCKTAQRFFKKRITKCLGTTGVPLQLLSSHGKTQFCMPLHTREVLMHMLLWQKNVLPAQGAETQTQVNVMHAS